MARPDIDGLCPARTSMFYRPAMAYYNWRLKRLHRLGGRVSGIRHGNHAELTAHVFPGNKSEVRCDDCGHWFPWLGSNR